MVIKCQNIEDKLNTTMYSRSKLDWLLDNEPFTYVELSLSGEMQRYCDMIDESTLKQNSSMLNQLMEQGYNETMARGIIAEFNMYDS